jgi:hypothetical protein
LRLFTATLLLSGIWQCEEKHEWEREDKLFHNSTIYVLPKMYVVKKCLVLASAKTLNPDKKQTRADALKNEKVVGTLR